MGARTNYDVAIVGGGPIGCVSAIAFARRGARVALFEANPRSSTRFAGEWIHPPGVAVLDRLRAGRLEPAETSTGYGFVVFPDDGSQAIQLPYPEGAVALTCDHAAIVAALREKAVGVGVDYVSGARVTAIEDQRLKVQAKDQPEYEVHAGRIVGAEGRSSITRRHLGYPESSTVLSYMASVELTDTELPHEGFGHVLLGGPGPVLMYRISKDRVRVCLDVPTNFHGARRDARFLWDAFSPLFPEALRPALRRGLEDRPLQWAATRFRPRAAYGEGNVALVGDSVGHFHPMTAAGLTLGFLDAESLATHGVAGPYGAEREKKSYVPELLANVLYHVLRREDENAAQVRTAVYDTWRKSRSIRETTMRFLTGDEVGTLTFGATFSRIASEAVSGSVSDSLGRGRWGNVPAEIAKYSEWVRWPAASLVPGPLRRRYRHSSTALHPIPSFDTPTPPTEAERKPTSRRVQSPAADPILRQARAALLEQISQVADQGEPHRADIARRSATLLRAVDVIEAALRVTPASDGAGRGRVAQSLRELAFDSARGVATTGAETLAETLLALLETRSAGGDGSEPIDAAVESLLRHQRQNALFAATGDPPLKTTSLACRALGTYARLYPAAVGAPVDQALKRALTRLRDDQRKDGSWSGTVTATTLAIDALVAAGAPPFAAEVRRGVRWISQQPANFSDPRDAARRLRAFSVARAPYSDAVDAAAGAAANALAAQLAEPRTTSWPVVCELVEGLSLYEAERVRRPQPNKSKKPAGADEVLEPVSSRRPPSVAVLPVEDKAKPTRADRHWCRARLEEVSRSFSKPILMLPEPLETAVTCGYLLCRIADTIEDHPALSLDQRDELFDRFLDVMRGRESSQTVVEAFQWVEGNPAEIELARGLPRVMRVFRALPRKIQISCTRWICEMARGMNLYVHRTPGPDGVIAVVSITDLERYCYYVAGTVGHMLTELFLDRFGENLSNEATLTLRRNSENFGAGLQLVNILKDITDDMERGVSYLPRNLCAEHGFEPRELFQPENIEHGHEVAAPLFEIARHRLDAAFEYTLAVPPTERGVRMFCLVPLWMAVRTLVHARGNDAMFIPGEAVKISRMEVAKLIGECGELWADDRKLRDAYARLWVAPGPRAVAAGDPA